MWHRFPDARTRFSEEFVEENGLRDAGFERWAFTPGMLFGAREKWWGDRGDRPRPHEGIDLCLFSTRSGELFRLGESCRVPAMFDGDIVKIEPDFLGESVYVDHGIDDGHGRTLWSLYGHTRPASRLSAGSRVRQGQIIAAVAGAAGRASGLFSHLHLSIAWVPTVLDARKVNWENLHDPEVASLLDPLHALGCAYKILDPDVSPQGVRVV